MRSGFVFTTCQPGAEAFLKEELRASRPDLRFAFSRPGFVTFKVSGEGGVSELDLDAPVSSPFARLSGLGFGRVTGDTADAVADAAAERISALGAELDVRLVHVVERGVDDAEAAATALAAEALRGRLGGWEVDRPLRRGEAAICCFPLDAGQWWLGARRLQPRQPPTASGRPPFAPPEDAPSRVWLKVEEALWRSGLLPMVGDRALDIGCAPGGGTWALLERGLRVVGVDPGEMAPQVAGHPNFEQRRLPFERLEAADLPPDVRWLVFDVSLAPRLTLGHLVRLAGGLPQLAGAIVTIKLANLAALKHLEWVRGRLRAMGMIDPLITQLAANRQELTAVGAVRRV